MEANQSFIDKCRAQRKFAEDQKRKFISELSEPLIEPILKQIDEASKRGEERVWVSVPASRDVAINLIEKLKERYKLHVSSNIETCHSPSPTARFQVWGW